MKIKLSNNFHGTEVFLIAKNNRISKGQIKRARNELCGLQSCICGDEAGLRGPQEVHLVYDCKGAKVFTQDS